MKKLLATLLLPLAALAGIAVLSAQPAASSAPVAPPATPKARLSPHETVSAVVDGSRVIIVYGRPYAKKPGTTEERKVWGSLVPYDKVWRTGSDEATLLITQKDMVLGGATIPAGAHSLFTWPNADGSAKLIVNRQIGQWGIPGRNQPMSEVYDEKNDVARVDLKKDAMEPGVEQFTIAIGRSAGGGGVIKLAWENTQYSVAISAKK